MKLQRLFQTSSMISLLAMVLVGLGCDNASRYHYQYATNTDTTTTATQTNAAEGLDLKALTLLVKEVKDAAELEKRLNTSGGINNLDLNADGKVDYIKVTEYGTSDHKGFSFTVEVTPGDVQEVATIELEKKENQVAVNTYGNQHIYGPGYSYRSSFGLSDVLITAWLFGAFDRPVYSSPYGYGNYPTHYGAGYSRAPSSQYSAKVKTFSQQRETPSAPIRQSVANSDSTKRSFSSSSTTSQSPSGSGGFGRTGTTGSSSGLKSPNAGKNATSVKAPLSNPTQAQRSFQTQAAQTRAASQTSRSGGFGRPASSRPSSSSVRSSSFGRSSFGGK